MEPSPPSSCDGCGCPLPSGTNNGICPMCLLAGGLEDGDGDMTAFDSKPATRVGSIIGRYKLLEEIGEGGFGIVYKAAQTSPVKRRVALKVIKPGMDSKEVIARFEAERQALALMDHPNISHVHDAGATDSGRPYFVMELVKGIPITTYCDEQNLTTKARIELFIDVCSAVQHAHQKGIIHRDLKPSNILVSAQHGDPVVKVIDFGIAKAISMELTEKTVFTELGRMIGTPQYMSPEQAHINVVDVDTRSDIHSLGVILYELLTGKTPLDSEKLRSAGYAEMQSMIRDELPVKPSACITNLGERLSLVAERRGTEPGRLHKTLRGGLDWIVMKALEKDRSRRYQTTNGLAVDLRRFLDDEPVSASPPSPTYRFVQFTRRHRAGVTWTAAICTVVLSAAIGMTMLYFRASAAGDREKDQKEKAEEQGKRATHQQKLAEEQTQRAEEQKKLAEEQRKRAEEAAWDSKLSEVNELRWNTNNTGRRFKALESLAKLIDIPPGLNQVGRPNSPSGSPARRKLRDITISCLAIADMETSEEWQSEPGHGRESMVAVNRKLKKYAHTFPDGRIGIYSISEQKALLDTLDPPDGEAAAVTGLLRFDPSGSLLAAAYDAGEGNPPNLKLWPLDQENPIAVKAGPLINQAFAFFPDGRQCAIGRAGSEPKLEIIDAKTGEPVNAYDLPGVPHSISVSADGSLLAVSIPGSGSVKVIRVADGGTESTLELVSPGALAWSQVDDSLAVCTKTFLAVWRGRDWSRENPARLELRPDAGVVEDAVAWSPDGRLLASQSSRDNRCRLWDPSQGGPALCWHKDTCSSLAFSEDGTRLGIFRSAQTLSLVEVASGDVCYRGRGHTGGMGIYDGVWSQGKPDEVGTLLATSGSDGVRLWNRDGRHLGHIKIEAARGIAFSKNSLFVASEGGLFEWQMKRETVDGRLRINFHDVRKIHDFDDCEQASLSPRGDWLAVAARSGDKQRERELWLIELDGEYIAHRLPQSEGVATCAISADGAWLAAGKKSAQGVSVWAMPGNEVPKRFASPVKLPVKGSARVAFSPLPFDLRTGKLTGEPVKWLVTGDAEKYQFWSTSSWEEDADAIESNMGERRGQLALSSRGTALAIAVNGGEMKVYGLPLSKKSSSPEELSSPDFDREIPLCFSPYGRIMVTVKPTGSIFFWRLDGVRTLLAERQLDWALPGFPTQQTFRLVEEVTPAVIDLPTVEE